MAKPPYVVGGLALMAGYVWCWVTGGRAAGVAGTDAVSSRRADGAAERNGCGAGLANSDAFLIMPGLVVVISPDPGHPLVASLTAMAASLCHEPFYISSSMDVPDFGVWAGWIAHDGSFAHRVSRYRHTDGSMLLFSGECLRSNSDTASPQMDAGSFAASVIEGCRAEGESHLRGLNGLFSGLIVDRVLKSCLLFNDRFGMERLYLHESAGAVLIASEAKAILRVAEATRTFDREGVAQYVKFGSTAGSRTLFKGITRLPGATAIRVSAGRISARSRYFEPGEWEGRPAMTPAQFTEALTDTMGRTVPEYLTGDQGIAFSITGGLDTRMILAGMPENGPTVHCYTFGGLSGETLDQRIGARLAAMCGLTHVSLRIDQRWLETFAAQVDRTVWVTDGTAGATTAHEIWLTGQGRALGTVRLTGNFGSEVLRSVSTLKAWTPPVGFLARGFLSDFEASLRRPKASILSRELRFMRFRATCMDRSRLDDRRSLSARHTSITRSSNWRTRRRLQPVIHRRRRCRLCSDCGLSWRQFPRTEVWVESLPEPDRTCIGHGSRFDSSWTTWTRKACLDLFAHSTRFSRACATPHCSGDTSIFRTGNGSRRSWLRTWPAKPWQHNRLVSS